jgi:hypothetical protein
MVEDNASNPCSIIKKMGSPQTFVRLIQIAMLGSMVMFTVVGELVHGSASPNNTLFYALSLASISTLGAAVVLRRTLVSPCEMALREKPDDAVLLARWKAGYILLYALCETLVLFGLILRISGFALVHVWGFYAGGFLLAILFSPRASQ